MTDDDQVIAKYRAELTAEAELARGDIDEIEDHLRSLAADLREQLSRYGRRPADVTVSARVLALPPSGGSGPNAEEWELAGDPDACADTLRRYAAAGAEHFLVDCPRGLSTAAMLEIYEFVAREVRPRLEAAR